MSYEGAFLDHGELLLYYTDCTSPFHISFWDIHNLDLPGGKSERKGSERDLNSGEYCGKHTP
jgi:hypothetical protein